MAGTNICFQTKNEISGCGEGHAHRHDWGPSRELVKSESGIEVLLEVYAYAGMYDKACDLYHMVLAAGLEPDATMYGSLMKFSAKVGRIALSQELLRKSEGVGCVKTCLWTIRSAGQQAGLRHGDLDGEGVWAQGG